MAKDKLRTFISKRMNSVSDPVTKFALIHVIEQRPPRFLLSRRVVRDELEDEIDSITEEIRDVAQDDSKESSRTQRYEAIAYGSEDQVISRYGFRMRGNPDSVDSGLDSEPATPQGALALSMRMTEAFAKMILAANASIITQQSEAIHSLTARNRHLEDKHLESLELLEQLLSNKHERDLEILQETRHEDRKDRLLTQGEGLVKKILPYVVEQMNAKKPISDFLQSLSDEQALKILSTLDESQQKALGKILEEKKPNGGNGKGGA